MMSERISFGSVSGSWTACILFGAMSVLFGWGVARLLRGRGVPDGTLEYAGASRRARLGCGTVTALVGLFAVWRWLWSGFYELRVEGRSMALRYLVPGREVSVPMRSVTALRWEPAAKSSRVLVIQAGDRELRSAQTSLDRATEAAILDSLRHRLADSGAPPTH